MLDTSIDMNAVSEFRNHYNEISAKRPSLYVTNDETITVVLPKSLLDFAEAAAGHSGHGSGARPVGIRRVVDDAREALSRIFESDASLAKFIKSSAKDYDYSSFTFKNKKTVTVTLNNEEARKVFWAKRDKSSYDQMANKYGKKCLDNDLINLTWNEFDLRYGMEAL